MTDARGSQEPGLLRRIANAVAVLLAVALQLLAGWITAASGLVAPAWALIVLAAVWVLAVAALVRVARTAPLASPLVPVGNALVWWAALTAGEVWLGWRP